MSGISNPVIKPDKFTVLTADFTVNNSTVLADSGLYVNLELSRYYDIEVNLAVDSSAVADAKIQIVANANWLYTPQIVYVNSTATGVVYRFLFNFDFLLIGGGGTFIPSCCSIKGVVYPVTSGLMTVWFAQNTAEASNTKLKAGSYIRYRRL